MQNWPSEHGGKKPSGPGMKAELGAIDKEEYTEQFFKKLINIYQVLSKDPRLEQCVATNCQALGQYSPFGFASLYSNSQLEALSGAQKVFSTFVLSTVS